MFLQLPVPRRGGLRRDAPGDAVFRRRRRQSGRKGPFFCGVCGVLTTIRGHNRRRLGRCQRIAGDDVALLSEVVRDGAGLAVVGVAPQKGRGLREEGAEGAVLQGLRGIHRHDGLRGGGPRRGRQEALLEVGVAQGMCARRDDVSQRRALSGMFDQGRLPRRRGEGSEVEGGVAAEDHGIRPAAAREGPADELLDSARGPTRPRQVRREVVIPLRLVRQHLPLHRQVARQKVHQQSVLVFVFFGVGFFVEQGREELRPSEAVLARVTARENDHGDAAFDVPQDLPGQIEEIRKVRHAEHERSGPVDSKDAPSLRVQEFVVHRALDRANLEGLLDLRHAVLLVEVHRLVRDEHGREFVAE
mmetsp:Transcript_3347/g.11041  ORF Transcript_3347/g.11041 Transcript_3347/m.11041 type:complete len:359 (+) Transcript_3347:453-1529(+)